MSISFSLQIFVISNWCVGFKQMLLYITVFKDFHGTDHLQSMPSIETLNVFADRQCCLSAILGSRKAQEKIK